jgi:hypothetical protein
MPARSASVTGVAKYLSRLSHRKSAYIAAECDDQSRKWSRHTFASTAESDHSGATRAQVRAIPSLRVAMISCWISLLPPAMMPGKQ